ncbi:MAG: hypothetical protein QM608_15565 [Caulobacter sp.]
MLQPLKLLLPALIPSWNFFDVIAPSPRIEYALLASPEAEPDWREFRPRPARMSPAVMLRRLFWNPQGNEALFLVSCAERLVDQPTAHSEDEIFRRIAADFGPAQGGWLRFRLVFLAWTGEGVVGEELYVSAPRRREDAA